MWQRNNVEGYTLAEMAEVMSWEQGKAFFDSHQVKDYTDLCRKVITNCGVEDRTQGTMIPLLLEMAFMLHITRSLLGDTWPWLLMFSRQTEFDHVLGCYCRGASEKMAPPV